jgi:protein gp37
MGATGIEWTRGPNGEQGYTFNPWIGCTRISPACGDDTGGGCYAEQAAKKLKVEWGVHAERRTVSEGTWEAPLGWDRAAAKAGEIRSVFCASMADILDNHRSIAPHWRGRTYDLIDRTPNLRWLLLSKRPELARRFLPAAWFTGAWPKNVWFGFTAENQTRFDHCAKHARDIPAPVIFMSGEPLLGRIMLPSRTGEWLKWVIAGGESGPLALCRDTPLDLFFGLHAECRYERIAYFQKQLAQISARAAYKDFRRFPVELQVREYPKEAYA